MGFSTGPCFPLCGMSGAPSCCFFYPHGSCVLSDLGACPGHQPDHKQKASRLCGKNNATTPATQPEAARRRYDAGFSSWDFSPPWFWLAPKATQPYFVQKAQGTWEKICNHPSCPPRGRQTTAQPRKTGQENTLRQDLAEKTWVLGRN